MSRLFDDAASQYAEFAGAALTAVPLTMACWFKSDSVTLNQRLMTIQASGSAGLDNCFNLFAAGATAGDPIRAVSGSATGASSSTGFTANTWHHACGVWSAVSARAAYINGSSKGTGGGSYTPAGVNRTWLGRYNDGQYLSGYMMEATIWNVALTDDEVAALGAGVSPLLIRPGSIVAYWPLRGLHSPEFDYIGTFPMTLTGPPTASEDAPRLWYPRRKLIVAKRRKRVATSTVTLNNIDGAATGDWTVARRSAASAITLNNADAAAIALHTPAIRSGSCGVAFNNLDAVATGQRTPVVRSATVVLVHNNLDATVAGQHTQPTRAGSAAVVTAGLSVFIAGQQTPAVRQGSGAMNLAAIQASAVADWTASSHQASASPATAAVTASAAGQQTPAQRAGIATLVTGVLQVNATGVHTPVQRLASASVSLPSITLAAAGDYEPQQRQGNVTVDLASCLAASVGDLRALVQGVVVVATPVLTASAIGSRDAAGHGATCGVVFAALGCDALGQHTGEQSGVVGVSLTALGCSSVGQHVPQQREGSASGPAAALGAAGVGQHGQPSRTGACVAVAPACGAAGTGQQSRARMGSCAAVAPACGASGTGSRTAARRSGAVHVVLRMLRVDFDTAPLFVVERTARTKVYGSQGALRYRSRSSHGARRLAAGSAGALRHRSCGSQGARRYSAGSAGARRVL